MKKTFLGRPAAIALLAGALAVLVAPAPVWAQAGPPLVTDDPDTPGAGKWEINMAAAGSRSRAGRWDITAPDLDINYGWGEHVQLKLDVPWAFASEPGQPTRSGLGRVNLGVKWRFVDFEDAGYALSIYPQCLSNWTASSKNRGITPPNDEFFLPLEVATKLGDYSLDAEIGRNFVHNEAASWVLGGVVSHGCGDNFECQIELHKTFEPQNGQTLLNFGLHWKLTESFVLLGAVGREIGARTPDQAQTVLYLGVQWLR